MFNMHDAGINTVGFSIHLLLLIFRDRDVSFNKLTRDLPKSIDAFVGVDLLLGVRSSG
jgi:hypothetical protein